MIELTPTAASDVFRGFFPKKGYTFRRCFAVLDGTLGGRILTDDATSPSWGAVHELSSEGTLFLAGSLTREHVAEIIDVLRRDRTVTVEIDDGNSFIPLMPDNETRRGNDIVFEDRDPKVDLEALIRTPTDLRLTRIDREIEPRCLWTPWMFRDGPTAVELGIGYCLLDGDRVVSECYAGPAVDGCLEMAVISDRAYRRRGLGRIVSARTALECERLGYQTWWHTSLENLASAAIARSLGYRSERHYETMVWEKPGV